MIKAEILLQEDQIEWTGSNDPTKEFFNTMDNYNLVQNIELRVKSFNHAILRTIHNARLPLEQATKEICEWIKKEEIVRVIGAGRARLAASIPANRLHHAGARVFVVHDTIPLPNTYYGGGVIAASASGHTPDVLQMMKVAKERNSNIRIIGIASESALEFKKLCDIFIPIDERFNPFHNPLKALADTGEHIISELLDAIIVAAALAAGKTDQDFRRGHEDLGPTGPYRPLEQVTKESTYIQQENKEVKLNKILEVLGVVRPKKINFEFLQTIIETLGMELEASLIIEELLKGSYLTLLEKKNLYNINASFNINQFEAYHHHQILFKAYNKFNNGEIEAAKEMVFHALKYDDYDSAYGIVFNSGNIESWFNQGQGKKIISLLNEFVDYIDFYEPRRQASILIAKAEAYSGISDHVEALNNLKEAFRCLPSEDFSSELTETKRTIWRLAGISSGDLGRTHNAMAFYRKAIAEDLFCNDPKTALCMGYLGYLYSDQQKMELAQKWIHLALKCCPEYRSPHVYSKNITNAALVQLYNGDIKNALDYFNKAIKITERSENEGGDIRERGRILCYKGLALFPSLRGQKSLVEHFENAENVCIQSGDKRRSLIALGLKGIAKMQLGMENGMFELREAIITHEMLNDSRNAFFESLSLMYLVVSDIHNEAQFYHEIETKWPEQRINEFNLVGYLVDEQFSYLLSFWWECIRPILFQKQFLLKFSD